jgi:hypothetical protein
MNEADTAPKAMRSSPRPGLWLAPWRRNGRLILSIVEELNELLGNHQGKGDAHAEGS